MFCLANHCGVLSCIVSIILFYLLTAPHTLVQATLVFTLPNSAIRCFPIDDILIVQITLQLESFSTSPEESLDSVHVSSPNDEHNSKLQSNYFSLQFWLKSSNSALKTERTQISICKSEI